MNTTSNTVFSKAAQRNSLMLTMSPDQAFEGLNDYKSLYHKHMEKKSPRERIEEEAARVSKMALPAGQHGACTLTRKHLESIG